MREIFEEITHHPEINFMTPDTQRRLQLELETVTKAAMEAEQALGGTFDSPQDWHDNFAYDNQRQQVQMLYKAKSDLENKLRNVSLLQPRISTDTIDVGNTIQVQFSGEMEPETFTILGRDDTHTRPEWISYATPLAEALIGATSGSIMEVELPNHRTTSVRVLSISEGQF